MVVRHTLLDMEAAGGHDDHSRMAEASTSFFRYLPVSKTDKRWGLYATTVGTSHCSPGTSYPPARHPGAYHFSAQLGRVIQEFQVVYITRGEGDFETSNSGPRRIKAGQVFLLFPGAWHRYQPDPGVGWDEHWLGFDGDYPRKAVKDRLMDPGHPVFDIGVDEDLVRCFGRAVELLKLLPRGYEQTLAALALEIVRRLHFTRSVKPFNLDAHSALVRQAKLYISQRPEELIELDALARQLGVSYSALRKAFKAHTGFGPHQYQLELRLAEAKALLAGTNQSVKDISARLGFQTPFYFSRFFKKRTSQAPEVWRRAQNST